MIVLSWPVGSGQKMTDCQGDGVVGATPRELYEKLTAQGDKVRILKTAKADKVRIVIPH